ncbi:hypothetical protein ES703_124769 [subsurface metagenome]
MSLTDGIFRVKRVILIKRNFNSIGRVRDGYFKNMILEHIECKKKGGKMKCVKFVFGAQQL